MMIAGYPNLFMIHGPGAPGVLFTMPLGGERHTAWIAACIQYLDEHGLGAIEPTEEAEAAWGHEITSMAERTLYMRTNSWYTGANVPGKPRQFLAHLQGSKYFDRINAIADGGFEDGFVLEERRAAGVPA